MKKIGIMGGTFNPVHGGHVAIALAAYSQFELDKVIFVPSGNPPHKRGMTIASDEDRFQMVSLAIAPYPFFEASTIEIEREGYSYTYETLNTLKQLYNDTQLYFIIGADSLYYFKDWRNPKSILENAILLVANRNNSDDCVLNEHIGMLQDMFGGEISIINIPEIDISSTSIRNGDFNHQLVPTEVIHYIEEHKLYYKNGMEE